MPRTIAGGRRVAPALSARGRLPPELIDMVIDHLYDDKVSLASCALVAKSWLNTSRLHLFHDLIIFHDRAPEPFRAFTAFMTEKPFICSLVKTLCINGYHASDRRQGRINAGILDAILGLLPALDTLLIVNCFWETRVKDENAVTQTLPLHRASLKNLYVTYFSAEQEHTYAKLEILRHFQKVERLRLDHVWLGHFEIDGEDFEDVEELITRDETEAGIVSRATSTQPEVTALTISLADICLNFLAYLWRQPFVHTMTTLIVQDLFQASYLENHEDLTFVGDAIRDTFGDQLEIFELDLPRLAPSGQHAPQT